MFHIQAFIQAIWPTEEEIAYLDRVFDIPSMEGYEDIHDVPFQDDDAPPVHPHDQHSLQLPAHPPVDR